MVKQSAINGFSLLESMLVLLIVVILSSVSFSSSNKSSLNTAAQMLMNLSLQTQQKAFIEKEEKSVTFYDNYALFDEAVFYYPKGLVCDLSSYHFNAKANISKAGTTVCRQNNKTLRLVFQLGSGRMRYEIK